MGHGPLTQFGGHVLEHPVKRPELQDPVFRVHGLSPGERIATLTMSLCTSIPATRSCITFICAATSCSGNPHRMGTGAPPARARSVQETDTRARSSNGGYPGRGSAPI